MSVIDLVFEGGGAKGMVFVGALEELLRDGRHSPGRLLGTSAGAIAALLLAAGYSSQELQAALEERDARGRPLFASFLGAPGPFDAETLRTSAVRRFLAGINIPGLPRFAERRMGDWITGRIARDARLAHLFSFVERGGWFSAHAFVEWLTGKLNAGAMNGVPRTFGNATFGQLHRATNVEVTLVAADTTGRRVLLLNHRTAPDCPVVWGARMSMSIPLLWQEVIWQRDWGAYRGEEMAGSVIVDGGILSNFPIALFLSARPEIGDVVGLPAGRNVLGLLIDDSAAIPGLPPVGARPCFNAGNLATVKRLSRLVQTMTGAHDNMATAVFARHVVRLPARGVGVIQFDMADAVREALVEGGRAAMRDFLAGQTVLELTGEVDLSAAPAEVSLADKAALGFLRAN